MEQLNFLDFLLDNNIEEKQLSETERLDQCVQPLLEWFEHSARTMPWRSNPEPYWVWISEIMLQQTRVEAVRAYFDRFIETLPNIRALAEVDEERLMKLWEGLGYYSRARNLKKAAIVCVEQYGETLPTTYEELVKLPGIGSYTAGAIASIAYEQEVPAVDGNVLRVISRLLAWEEDITKQSVKRKMETVLRDLMHRIHPNPRTFTAALMELGALVCIPNGTPYCMKCPWNRICLARMEKKLEQIPVKKKKTDRKIEERTVFLIQDGDLTAIQKRPSTGLLAGLYELPNILGFYSKEEVKRLWEEKLNIPLNVERLKDGKHVFSHIEWHMQAYRIIPKKMEQNKLLKEDGSNFFFVTKEQLKNEYALPNAFKTWKN